ncbi:MULTISPECIES: ATP-binding cassette domain-containing protein [unclassified Acinetobacter]|uniref:ATP-binding cassette domain-containing protein n=1 Tax=unclassified Acinetobacter TaxID=196816 RepID=UPI0024495A49|nr:MULTISPECIES: ATP-binding cassette domain-containing protein [unclassified Acinetobacter]MDH0031028.1 ATP-binding cassette domain-containing protein [Acinetobacter sp. GD04021]MDH0886600.1 ATP-binding cassette domain-containing protein [Acinetobacter sp. GD03873]MDH1082962.1 ATP-binding cassette domain-containing protein [Acinetobacter sp. GD03983]MDH2190077.1 ATP-binding cassette domain-containing protein [Acinetobacter sp. GD03645]MDH2203141.1 ATP-binding cassette domain-containing protei
MIDCYIQLQQGQFSLDQRFQSDQSVIGLFGASGSGKTTILHSIAGLIRPQSGWIKIQNQTWFDQGQNIYLSTQQRRVGLVFQDAQLFPHKNVKQNLLFGFKHIAPQQRKFELDYIIELLKLEHLVERMPIKLSGGEKQRVALGRALLYSPQLLLLDEPLSALDTAHKAEIIPFFQRVKQDIKIPMLYVSHDQSEIKQLSDTIWYL